MKTKKKIQEATPNKRFDEAQFIQDSRGLAEPHIHTAQLTTLNTLASDKMPKNFFKITKSLDENVVTIRERSVKGNN